MAEALVQSTSKYSRSRSEELEAGAHSHQIGAKEEGILRLFGLGDRRCYSSNQGNACRSERTHIQRGGPTDSLGSRALAVRPSRAPSRDDLNDGHASPLQDRNQN
ncbi:hypothetical protein X975_26419, partial [Stegodyphus mimosarum]